MSRHRLLNDIFESPHVDGGKLITGGNTVPVDGTSGYHFGCDYYHLDGSGLADAKYTNIGTLASCEFVSSGSAPLSTSVIADTSGITANDIVYVSGYDTTTGDPKVDPADADTIATMRDLYFAPNAITAAAAGFVYKAGLITAVNTNAGEVGDPVYLSTTAGGWTLTAPTTDPDRVVEIGSILVKSATVGVINIDLAGAERIMVHDHSDTGQGENLQITAFGSTAFSGAIVPATDEVMLSDDGVAKTCTYQVLMDGINDLASFTGAVVPATDGVMIDDGGTAKVSTYQVFMDGMEDLTAAGAGAVAADKIPYLDGGVAENITVQNLFNVSDLTAMSGAIAPATDKIILQDDGVAKLCTYQVLMDGVGDLTAGAIATTDTLLFIDADDGVAKIESIDDIATLFAGTNLTATAGVINLDANLTGLESVTIAGAATGVDHPIDMNSVVAMTGDETVDCGNVIKINRSAGAVGGTHSGIICKNYITGTAAVDGTGLVSGLYVNLKYEPGSENAAAEVSLIETHLYSDSSDAIDYGWYCLAPDSKIGALLGVSGTMASFMEVKASGAGGFTVGSDAMTKNPESDTEDAYLTINIEGGASYQIPAYTA